MLRVLLAEVVKWRSATSTPWSREPEVMTPTTSGLNFSMTLFEPLLQVLIREDGRCPRSWAVEFRALGSLKWREKLVAE